MLINSIGLTYRYWSSSWHSIARWTFLNICFYSINFMVLESYVELTECCKKNMEDKMKMMHALDKSKQKWPPKYMQMWMKKVCFLLFYIKFHLKYYYIFISKYQLGIIALVCNANNIFHLLSDLLITLSELIQQCLWVILGRGRIG